MIRMKVRIELDEDDLRKAVILYFKMNDRKLNVSDVSFSIQKEEGYADKICCRVDTNSLG